MRHSGEEGAPRPLLSAANAGMPEPTEVSVQSHVSISHSHQHPLPLPPPPQNLWVGDQCF